MLEPITLYINKNYGSKRGLFNHAVFFLLYRFGFYKNLEMIEWDRVERLVFVCAGNICRSPLAWLHAKRLSVESESFGLSGDDGFPADPRAIQFAFEQGMDLSIHVAKNIRNYKPRSSDLVVGMEPIHAESLKRFCKKEGAQLTLAGLWLDHPKPYIHDPFSANPDFFNKCEQEVVRAVDRLVHRLKGE